MAESRKYATDLDLQGNSIINGGFEVVESLPTTNNFEGRQVVYQGRTYTFHNGEYQCIADDLGGREETREEQFTYQATANDESVKDGLAIVKSIKGNTVVANQLVPTSDRFVGTQYCTIEILGEKEVKVTPNIDTNYAGFYAKTQVKTIVGHKYFISFDIKGDTSFTGDFLFGSWSFSLTTISVTETYNKQVYIKECIESNYIDFMLRFNGNAYYLKNYILIDLTQEFREGNEPATVEEFERLYPNLPKEYNTGSLLNLNAEAIKSVEFNAFNGEYAQVLEGMQYYLGGNITSLAFKENLEDEGEVIEIPSDNLYTPNTNGYLVATGNDICINLSHSGYRNGEYEPYKESIVNLPIKKYFPDGMKSAGEVRDEIIWDESIGKYKAIQRVGSLDLGTLQSWRVTLSNDYRYGFYAQLTVNILYSVTKSNILTPKYKNCSRSEFISNITNGIFIDLDTGHLYVCIKDSNYAYTDIPAFQKSLQGQILYYELETPIETIIDDYDLIDYEVSDFGTEEIIAVESTTPIIADIQYGFNAVDEIRNHRFEIRDLKKLISRGFNLNGVNVKLGDTSTIPAYIPYDDVLYPVRIQGNWLQIYRNGVWGNLFNLASEVIPSLYLEEFEGDWYNPNILEYILSGELTTKLISDTLDFRSILTSIQRFAGVKLSLQAFSPKEYDKSLDNILQAVTGYIVYVENDIDTMFNSGNSVLVKLNFDVVNRVTIECYIQR